MAGRFFERIARTYRREKWDLMLRPLLKTWYMCAQQIGDVELSVRLLLEMLANGYCEWIVFEGRRRVLIRSVADPAEPLALTEDLQAVLKVSRWVCAWI
jgi:hypothetical protein